MAGAYKYKLSNGREVLYSDPTMNAGALRDATFVGQEGLMSSVDPLVAYRKTVADSQAANQLANQRPAASTSTPANTYLTGYDYRTPEEISAENAVLAQRQSKATQVVDEEAIRAKKLAEMQAEIDATNSLYAGKLKSAQIVGQNRLGQSTAIQGRRGLLGSDFGAAATDTVQAGNQEVYNSIEEQRNSVIQNILSSVRSSASKEFADKTAAKEAGVEDYLAYLKGQKEAKSKKPAAIAQMILDSGYTADELKSEISRIAEDAGVSADAIIGAYKNLAYTKDQEANKAQLEADKASADMEKVKAETQKISDDKVAADKKFIEDARQFGLTYALEQRKVVAAEKAAESKGNTANTVLTPAESVAFDVPYGTTSGQVEGKKALSDVDKQNALDLQTAEGAYQGIEAIASKYGIDMNNIDQATVGKMTDIDAKTIAQLLGRVTKPDVSKAGGEVGDVLSPDTFFGKAWKSFAKNVPLQILPFVTNDQYGKDYTPDKLAEALSTAKTLIERRRENTKGSQTVASGTSPEVQALRTKYQY